MSFLPFIGTRYDPTKVDLASVVSPPYDVISTEYREVLYQRDPHNIIRIEWSHDEDPYGAAADTFKQWKHEGIFRREQQPAFYVYSQIFDVPGTGQVTRTGVIGRLQLTAYSEHR